MFIDETIVLWKDLPERDIIWQEKSEGQILSVSFGSKGFAKGICREMKKEIIYGKTGRADKQ